jgi:hypothetical protein
VEDTVRPPGWGQSMRLRGGLGPGGAGRHTLFGVCAVGTSPSSSQLAGMAVWSCPLVLARAHVTARNRTLQ